METEIIKTDDENIVIEKITTQTEINLTLIREERD